MTSTENFKYRDDAQFATYLATETGKRLVELRKELVSRGFYGWDLKDAGDAMAQEFLMSQLNEHRPNDAVLSEEAVDNTARLSAKRVWISDPLDGTQEFSEPERHDWAVHVALWESSETSDGALVAGAVSLPAIELTLSTDPIYKTPEKHDGPPRLVMSRTRTPREAILVADALGCEAVRLGSAGAKAMSVVLGECDIYLHTGGQHQWDSAAPVAVARAAGLFTSRIDGSELIYNQADTWLPELIVGRAELAEPVLAALRNSAR